MIKWRFFSHEEYIEEGVGGRRTSYKVTIVKGKGKGKG